MKMNNITKELDKKKTQNHHLENELIDIKSKIESIDMRFKEQIEQL